MQFGSRNKRAIWINSLIGLIPDLLVVGIIAALTDSGFLGFMLAFFGLYILYFLIWIKNSIAAWLVYFLKGKKILAQSGEDFFKANKFPEPNEYEDSVGDYLEGIANNKELDTEIRLRAASLVAFLDYPLALNRFQERLRWLFAYEEALSNYKKFLETQKD